MTHTFGTAWMTDFQVVTEEVTAGSGRLVAAE
jgi:hypothetical protein